MSNKMGYDGVSWMKRMKKITKAVIPAAGIGTRFLPWTKAMPKEMLPIIDRPVLHYIVEECVEAGIEEIVVVTSWHKNAIENYFAYSPELEWRLEQQGKLDKLSSINSLMEQVTMIYLHQKGPYGNATPVLEAHKVVDEEPFVVLWGDQFIGAEPSRLEQCLRVWEEYGKSVVAALEVDEHHIPHSGIGRVRKLKDNVYELEEIVEKPSLKEAPSNLMCSGVYIFKPDIFEVLEHLEPGRGGEYWLVDAINQQARQGKTLAVKIENGVFYNTGDKWSYHKTVVDYMLKDVDIGRDIADYMREKLKDSAKVERGIEESDLTGE